MHSGYHKGITGAKGTSGRPKPDQSNSADEQAIRGSTRPADRNRGVAGVSAPGQILG